jgi:hypothetical protein
MRDDFVTAENPSAEVRESAAIYSLGALTAA